MARKLYELEEAAKMLGVTPEHLNEMRDRREVYAVRDGGAWKFKAEEVERLIRERADANKAEEMAPEFSELDDGLDSILLSEVELGLSGPSTSSTVIGKSNVPSSPESDIQIARQPESPSDLNLDLARDSDVRLASPSEISKAGGSDLGVQFDELDALDLDLPSALDSGISLGSDALREMSKDNLSLDDDAPLTIDKSSATPAKSPATPHKESTPPAPSSSSGSSLDLGGESDEDLVLGGSGPGSDVTRSAGDSGISLLDPADSGLSLEQSDLGLGRSKVDALELGDDDDMVLLEEGGSASAAPTDLKADDDFLLTPLEESSSEESDSGSQVIALDSESSFDESAATMLAPGGFGVTALEEDLGDSDVGLGSLGGVGAGLGPSPGMTPSPVASVAMASPHEMTFSGWNIALLSICLVVLLLSGMMMYDLMRNMWSWGGAYSVNSSLMDMILSWFER